MFREKSGGAYSRKPIGKNHKTNFAGSHFNGKNLMTIFSGKDFSRSMGAPVNLLSANLEGFRAEPVTVEVDLTKGLARFKIVGLPDKAVEEARERIAAAVFNSGAKPPQHQNSTVTVNLAPADMKKRGTWFDLPIALAYLTASNQLNPFGAAKMLVVGELGLDGVVRRVNGVLPAAVLAKSEHAILVVPEPNLSEAMLVQGLKILPVNSLEGAIKALEEGREPYVGDGVAETDTPQASDYDFGFIRGQAQAKRALELAAAGGHNIRMSGPPGSGKTLLARALPTIMPPLTGEEQIAVTTIWSVAGLLNDDTPLITLPPLRAPHHSASRTALVGGGSGRVSPGEVTLAHRGVLFLDEFPEFPRHVLEALRQPVEDGVVTVSRSGGSATYPARFLLVTAQNPCPCGNLTDPERECVCVVGEIERYKRRVSGPMLDRIDLHVDVPRLPFSELRGKDAGAESSADVLSRVAQARVVQRERFREATISMNAEMLTQTVEEVCTLDGRGEELLKRAHDSLKLSPRGLTRILKVSRTIADLAGATDIASEHIAEAIQYRREVGET